jgi:hypothetical protein
MIAWSPPKIDITPYLKGPDVNDDPPAKRKKNFNKRQYEGKVVIWPEDREPFIGKQGVFRYYMNTDENDTCLNDWLCMIETIPEKSGKHSHQGGLAIFVIEGEGTTVFEDVPYDWEEGDLMVQPINDGGMMHQHFNRSVGKNARWFAFMNHMLWDNVGNLTTQVETSPFFTPKEEGAPAAEAAAAATEDAKGTAE